MCKIGDYLIHKQTKEVFEITNVWDFPSHVEARNCAYIIHPQNQYFFMYSEISRSYHVLDRSAKAAQLLYIDKSKAVIDGKSES